MSIPSVAREEIASTNLPAHQPVEGRETENKVLVVSKKRLAEAEGENPRSDKQIRVTEPSVNFELRFPEGMSQGRVLIEVILDRPAEEEVSIFSEEYAGKEPDGLLRFDGNEKLNVHKEKLMQKSEFFQALFSSKWEKDEEEVHLKEIDFAQAKQILRDMYQENLVIGPGNFFWVLDLAQKWGMDDLLRRCDQSSTYFFHPHRWQELIPYIQDFEEMIVDYVAVNACHLFWRDEFTMLPAETFMKVLDHPDLNVKHVNKKVKAFYRWAKANCPVSTPLKDYLKSVHVRGKRFLDSVNLDQCILNDLGKIFGEEDLFTLQEVTRLIKLPERKFMTCLDGEIENTKNPRIPKFHSRGNIITERSYKGERKTTWSWRIREENCIHAYSSGPLKWDRNSFEFQIQCCFNKGNFILCIDPLTEFDGSFTAEFTLFNQFDLRKSLKVESGNEELEATLLSKEELFDPHQGWIVDDCLVVSAKFCQ